MCSTVFPFVFFLWKVTYQEVQSSTVQAATLTAVGEEGRRLLEEVSSSTPQRSLQSDSS